MRKLKINKLKKETIYFCHRQFINDEVKALLHAKFKYLSFTNKNEYYAFIGADYPITIDYEIIEPRDYELIAKKVFNWQELAQINDDRTYLTFYQYWTAKESLFKILENKPEKLSSMNVTLVNKKQAVCFLNNQKYFFYYKKTFRKNLFCVCSQIEKKYKMISIRRFI